MRAFSHKLVQLLFTGLLLSVALPAAAGAGQERLQHFLDGLVTMRAEFVQSLVDPNMKVLEESSGILQVKRPGKFRLSYRQPYEQLYVADGERMWMYDKDLEQITVKKEEQALGSTPALLLSGTEPLENNFNIEELGEHEGFQWLELKPKEKDANFEYIRLALEGDELRAMEMTDGFAQTTRLYFSKMERNPKIDAAEFSFIPPPGVDVIGDTP